MEQNEEDDEKEILVNKHLSSEKSGSLGDSYQFDDSFNEERFDNYDESEIPGPEKKKGFIKICKQAQFCYLIVCIICCCLIGMAFFIGMTFLVRYLVKNEKKHEEKIPTDPLGRAIYLAERTPLIDGHNDIIERVLGFGKKNISITIHLDKPLTTSEIHILDEYNTTLMTDVPRMRQGHVGCQFWAVYVNCNITGYESVYRALESFRYVQDMIQVYSEDFQQIFSSGELSGVFSKGKKIGGIPGVEGGQMINENLNILREYYRLGARYLTLTHNCNTQWADSCCDPTGPKWNGLRKPFGEEVLVEMNRIGMIIDLSHVSVEVMEQALDITKAPVMFSHSNARALCNHTRNVPDDILVRLKKNNGIVMVTFVPVFLSEIERLEFLHIQETYPSNEVHSRMLRWEIDHPEERATLSTVADHIDHIRKIHGNTEHIGIGSDFDGISYVPLHLEDSSKFMDLFAELIKRGYKDFEIKQILGENLLRVLKDVEDVSVNLGIDTIFKK